MSHNGLALFKSVCECREKMKMRNSHDVARCNGFYLHFDEKTRHFHFETPIHSGARGNEKVGVLRPLFNGPFFLPYHKM